MRTILLAAPCPLLRRAGPCRGRSAMQGAILLLPRRKGGRREGRATAMPQLGLEVKQRRRIVSSSHAATRRARSRPRRPPMQHQQQNPLQHLTKATRAGRRRVSRSANRGRQSRSQQLMQHQMHRQQQQVAAPRRRLVPCLSVNGGRGSRRQGQQHLQRARMQRRQRWTVVYLPNPLLRPSPWRHRHPQSPNLQHHRLPLPPPSRRPSRLSPTSSRSSQSARPRRQHQHLHRNPSLQLQSHLNRPRQVSPSTKRQR